MSTKVKKQNFQVGFVLSVGFDKTIQAESFQAAYDQATNMKLGQIV